MTSTVVNKFSGSVSIHRFTTMKSWKGYDTCIPIMFNTIINMSMNKIFDTIIKRYSHKGHIF